MQLILSSEDVAAMVAARKQEKKMRKNNNARFLGSIFIKGYLVPPGRLGMITVPPAGPTGPSTVFPSGK